MSLRIRSVQDSAFKSIMHDYIQNLLNPLDADIRL